MADPFVVKQMLEAIANGEADGAFDQMWDALRQRQRILRDAKTAQNRANLKIGSRVVLDGLSPKILNGQVGEVVEFKNTRVKVQLDRSIPLRGRMTADVTVPASTVEMIG